MKKKQTMLTLMRQRQALARDTRRRHVWKTVTERTRFAPGETALLLCDVWDSHWSRAARERLADMLPRMSRLVNRLRRKGVLIIHAPSDCMDFYQDHPARQAVLAVRPVTPKERKHADPPLPFPSSSALADTPDAEPAGPPYPWTRQHKAIRICDEDAISADGREVYSLLKSRGIKRLLIAGVHANMCVLHRSFGIKQMTRWGVDVTLVGDLTDCIYDPAQPPYVSQAEGTRLVVAYVEKFWCPTAESKELMGR